MAYEYLQYGIKHKSFSVLAYDLKCADVSSSNELNYEIRFNFHNMQEFPNGRVIAT